MKTAYSFSCTLIFSLLFLSNIIIPQTVKFEDNKSASGITIVNENKGGIQLNFAISEFNMNDIQVEGINMKSIQLPGVFLPGETGYPDLPGISKYVAIPNGGGLTYKVHYQNVIKYENIEVAPAPRIPFENEDGPLDYFKNTEVYSENKFYPESPIILSDVQKIRGIESVVLALTPFQYNPVTKELLVYKNINFELSFSGGKGTFGEQRLRNRFWEPMLKDMFINYNMLPKIESKNYDNLQGFEYLIITPDNPSYIAWADSIKNRRNREGIKTGVVTLTTIGGNTTALIESYLNNAYNTWELPPAAFLILGDYSTGTATGNGVISPIYNNYCVSDNMFADVNGDHMPDMAHARIVAENATQLSTILTKTFNYEDNPPVDVDYYKKPLIAGGWQTERWFILCAEVIYGYLTNHHAKTPVRQYAIYSGTPGSSWSSNQNTNMVLNYFGPNGTQYIPATPQHLTNWSGNTSGINAALNAGSYILIHRDHGSVTGWGEPAYNNTSLNGLNNNFLPFVFSLNCLTGKYNSSSESFAEKFIRMTKGALGLIAASETSYSFVNDAYAWGMFDYFYPDFDPGYGQAGQHTMLPAFGNVYGKYYLKVSSFPYNTSNKVVTYHLFHHHGDAYTSIYTEVPQVMQVTHDTIIAVNQSQFNVLAEAGAYVCISKNNEIIAAEEVTGTEVVLNIGNLSDGDILMLTVSKQNRFRYSKQIRVIEGGVPVELLSFSASTMDNGVMLEWSTATESNNKGFEIERVSTSTSEIIAFVDGKGTTTETQTYSFLDKNPSNEKLTYRLHQLDFNGTKKEVSSTEIEVNNLPVSFALNQNFPNPFNPSTVINYDVPVKGKIALVVYDVIGNTVAELVNEVKEPGRYNVNFDASGLSSGLYIYQLKANGFVSSKKMMYLK